MNCVALVPAGFVVTHKTSLFVCHSVYTALMVTSVLSFCSVRTVSSQIQLHNQRIPRVKSYRGYRVYDVYVSSEEQATRVVRQAESCSAELWNDERVLFNSTLQLQVPPFTAGHLERALNQSGIAFQLRIADIQRLIDEQTGHHQPISRRLDESTVDKQLRIDYSHLEPFYHEKYHSFSEIRRYLERLSLENRKNMKLNVIGWSHEKRPIYMARLMSDTVRRKRGESRRSTPVMWLDCGIHAREWVSPAICMFIIDRLLTTDSHWLHRYDWHVVPVVNPDGYVYSHEVDRLWRKNRSPNHYCKGVDLNRNFAALWGTFGVTFFECGATFPGYHPFSEPESRAIRDAILRDRRRIVAFNSIHSYGQLWLIPYGYMWKRSPHYRQQIRVASRATKAMHAVNGARYRYGVSSLLLYLDSGTSTDWAYGKGIRHSVAIEARDNGFYGFLLPPRFILPTAHEVWVGLQAQAEELL